MLLTHSKEEGELGVSVMDVSRLPVGDVHEGHDDVSQGREGLIDAASLLQPVPEGTNS